MVERLEARSSFVYFCDARLVEGLHRQRKVVDVERLEVVELDLAAEFLQPALLADVIREPSLLGLEAAGAALHDQSLILHALLQLMQVQPLRNVQVERPHLRILREALLEAVHLHVQTGVPCTLAAQHEQTLLSIILALEVQGVVVVGLVADRTPEQPAVGLLEFGSLSKLALADALQVPQQVFGKNVFLEFVKAVLADEHLAVLALYILATLLQLLSADVTAPELFGVELTLHLVVVAAQVAHRVVHHIPVEVVIGELLRVE